MSTQDTTQSGGTPQGGGAQRPEVTPPESWSFPAYATHELSNGLRVLAYDVPGQYVLSLRMALPVALTAEPREREGVGTIMARCLDEGTEQHDAEEFAELLERKGIALGAGFGDAGLQVEIDVAVRNLEPALDAMREVLAEPSFPESEVARLVRHRLAQIEQERAIPGHRAAHEIASVLYADRDRASRPTAGSKQSVSAITREDVVRFHAEQVAPRGGVLAIAGHLDGLDVVGLMERTIGTWAPENTPERTRTEPSELAEDRARIVIVDRPGSVQTEIAMVTPGPDRHVEGGWAPFPVLGYVIGGSPNARIDAVLREDKGYTYGIRSGFRPRRFGGIFSVSGSVRADATVESLQILTDILAGVGTTSPLGAEEVRAGVDFISRTSPGRYATADAVADEAMSLATHGLGTETITSNLADMLTVDPARAEAAYREHVDGKWTIVVVGDAAKISGGISGLNVGKVTVIS